MLTRPKTDVRRSGEIQCGNHRSTGVDLGFDVDLYVSTGPRTMTSIWMGYETVRVAIDSGRMILTGDRGLASNIQTWLGLSPFAKERNLAG